MRRFDADRVWRDENSPFDLFLGFQNKSNRRAELKAAQGTGEVKPLGLPGVESR